MTSQSQSPPRRYRFADLALDTGQRRLWRDDEQIPLSKLTFDFLLTLVEAAPNLVTQDQLAEAVWGPRRVVSPETFSQRLKTLRGALGERADQPRYIEAVRGQGCRLIPSVTVIDAAAHAGGAIRRPGHQPIPSAERLETPARLLVSESEATEDERRRDNSSTGARDRRGRAYAAAHKLHYAITALLAVAVAYLILDGRRAGEAGIAAADAERTDRPAVIAVLPFANHSADPEQEYFAEGLSEELMNTLHHIDDLEVRSRSVSLSLMKGSDEDLSTRARTLGVDYVLEGSVQKDGDDVRIRTRLTNAHTGLTQWSGTYERTLHHIFAIHDDIAASVATALQVTLVVGELRRLPGMTRDVEAYGEYLQGVAAYKAYLPESIPRAIDHLLRATELDPEFALAWYTLSRTYADGLQDLPRSEEALERARALTPDAPYVLRGVADARAARGDWLSAGAFYEDLPADVESITTPRSWAAFSASSWAERTTQRSSSSGHAPWILWMAKSLGISAWPTSTPGG